jgi:hypothetical protein
MNDININPNQRIENKHCVRRDQKREREKLKSETKTMKEFKIS